MTPAPAHVKTACPVCGVELAHSRTNNSDGSIVLTLTPYGTDHVGAHYK